MVGRNACVRAPTSQQLEPLSPSPAAPPSVSGRQPRKCLRDMRARLAVGVPAAELADAGGELLGLAAGEVAPEDADDGGAFEEGEVEGEFGNVAGGEADVTGARRFGRTPIPASIRPTSARAKLFPKDDPRLADSAAVRAARPLPIPPYAAPRWRLAES